MSAQNFTSQSEATAEPHPPAALKSTQVEKSREALVGASRDAGRQTHSGGSAGVRFPFPAYLVRPNLANGYTDAVSIRLVWVLSLDRTAGVAEVEWRVGSGSERCTVLFNRLASDPAAAIAKLTPSLSALLTVPPPSSLAGMMESSAALSPAIAGATNKK